MINCRYCRNCQFVWNAWAGGSLGFTLGALTEILATQFFPGYPAELWLTVNPGVWSDVSVFASWGALRGTTFGVIGAIIAVWRTYLFFQGKSKIND